MGHTPPLVGTLEHVIRRYCKRICVTLKDADANFLPHVGSVSGTSEYH
jgi:hypothetical protein